MTNFFLRDFAGEVESFRTCEVCGKQALPNRLYCSDKCKAEKAKGWRCIECGAKTKRDRNYCSICRRRGKHLGKNYQVKG